MKSAGIVYLVNMAVGLGGVFSFLRSTIDRLESSRSSSMCVMIFFS